MRFASVIGGLATAAMLSAPVALAHSYAPRQMQNLGTGIPASCSAFFHDHFSTFPSVDVRPSYMPSGVTVVLTFPSEQGLAKRMINYNAYRYDNGLATLDGLMVDGAEGAASTDIPIKPTFLDPTFVATDAGPKIISYVQKGKSRAFDIVDAAPPGTPADKLSAAEERRTYYRTITEKCQLQPPGLLMRVLGPPKLAK